MFGAYYSRTKGRYIHFELEFETEEIPFAESIGTSLDLEKRPDKELWSNDMDIPFDENDVTDNTHLLMSGTIVFIITVTSRTMSISCIKSNNCFRFQHQSNGKIFIFLRSFIRHYDYQRNISKKAMLSYMTVFKPLEMAYLLITRLQMHNLNLNQVGMTLSLAILLKSRI